MRYLTIALAKGRLAMDSLDILERIGISCDEIRDKSSRKLIFTNEELKLRFFLAKANDIPTYVEYGAADIGIVGKDTILEEGRKMYEVLTLASEGAECVWPGRLRQRNCCSMESLFVLPQNTLR